jgi:hypothetical protein
MRRPIIRAGGGVPEASPAQRRSDASSAPRQPCADEQPPQRIARRIVAQGRQVRDDPSRSGASR